MQSVLIRALDLWLIPHISLVDRVGKSHEYGNHQTVRLTTRMRRRRKSNRLKTFTYPYGNTNVQVKISSRWIMKTPSTILVYYSLGCFGIYGVIL